MVSWSVMPGGYEDSGRRNGRDEIRSYQALQVATAGVHMVQLSEGNFKYLTKNVLILFPVGIWLVLVPGLFQNDLPGFCWPGPPYSDGVGTASSYPCINGWLMGVHVAWNCDGFELM